jgi:16S rRNA processing protein RimM
VTVLLEVGRIGRPHGLRGDVLVHLTTNVDGRLSPGSVLFADPAGTRRLVVESSQPHHQRWIVGFAGCLRREDADDLRGTVLYGEPVVDDDPDTLWVHELIGAEVHERDGRSRGRVVAVIDNPASDLLELDGGGLVPLRFVVEHTPARPGGDGGTGRLVVDVPAGLFDT